MLWVERCDFNRNFSYKSKDQDAILKEIEKRMDICICITE